MLTTMSQLRVIRGVLILMQIAINYIPVSAIIRVSSMSPVNPVKIGGILSIRCQVWSLNASLEVTMSRKCGSGPTERLSWNQDVLPAIEDRVFLAARKLQDASTIFFLSVIDIDKTDQCDYTCKVINSDTLHKVAGDTVSIEVYHFPEDSFPMCSSSLSPTYLFIKQGDSVSLNCSSEVGKPLVELEWSIAGQENDMLTSARQRVRHGMVFSQVTVYPKDQTIYICTIKSIEFPEIIRVCHVGPITVMQTSTEISNKAAKATTVALTKKKYETDHVSQSPNKSNDFTSDRDCTSVCPRGNLTHSFLQLKITTISVSILAIILFLIVIALKVKLPSGDNLRTFKNAKGHSFTYVPTASSDYETTYRGYNTTRYQERTLDVRSERQGGNTM